MTYIVGDDMTDNEYAVIIYCEVYRVKTDDGDAYIHGILDAINTLDEREQAALEGYYRYGNSFEQIGKSLGGIKREAARHVVYKAMQKLRHQSRRRNMSVSAIVDNLNNRIEVATTTVNELYDQIEQFIRGVPIDQKTIAAIEKRKRNVAELNLSTRTYNHLLKAGINNVEQLLFLDTLDGIMAKRGFGQIAYNEILTKMREQGYYEWADRIEHK